MSLQRQTTGTTGYTTAKYKSIAEKSNRRGMLMYLAICLIALLSVLGSTLMYISAYNEHNAGLVYQNELITNIAESAAEEAFLNFEEQLNSATDTKIYEQVRAPLKPGETVNIDAEYMAQCTQATRKRAEEAFGITPANFVVEGMINRVQPFNIRGATIDEFEKNAALTVKVIVTHKYNKNEITKIVAISRPVKVVRCSIPVLSECTLFVNNNRLTNYAEWSSVLGFDQSNFPKEQNSLVLDHGWASYSTTNTKEDFISNMEERVIPKGAVPPGRVYLKQAIVPVTNGNRSSGMLQKTFFSGESELLPTQFDFTLKQLREHYKQAGIPTDDLETTDPDATGENNGENSEGTTPDNTDGNNSENAENSTDSEESTATTSGGDVISKDIEKSKIVIRYIGHGKELALDNVDKLIGKDISGYRPWFQSFIDDDWKQKGESYAKSGLDLFGRVEEKVEGESVTKQAEGWWAKIKAGFKKLTDKIMKKLYSKYNIKISPTIVYGQVLRTFFGAVDYVEGKWVDKIKNSVTLSGNEKPLPWFPKGFLDGKDEKTPLEITDLPSSWDKKTKEKFGELPPDIRKPKFFKYLDQTIFSKNTYGLDSPQWKKAIERLPHGAMYRPYNQGIIEFLGPLKPDSYLGKYFGLLQSKNVFFMQNEIDVAADDNAIGRGPFETYFKEGLDQFNPFLYYVKATDYISSLTDPRLAPKSPGRNVFKRKYYNGKEGVLHLDGVIYITGTEPLRLGNIKYTGKAIIITFGSVVFTGFVAKEQDSADEPENNDLLTIVSLGGIDIQTKERIDAQLYSYIFPIRASKGDKIHVFGGLGCNDLQLRDLPAGGNINFDWTYHIPPEMDIEDRKHYYHVSITDEISKYEFVVKRQSITGNQDEQ